MGKVMDCGTIAAFSLFYKILVGSVVMVVGCHAESHHNISCLPVLEKRSLVLTLPITIHIQLSTIPSPSLLIIALLIEGQSKDLEVD